MVDGVVLSPDGQVLGAPSGATGFESSAPPSGSPDAPAVNGEALQAAQQRLAQIYSDPKLRDQLLVGQPSLTREWRDLTRTIHVAGESVQAGQVVTTSGEEQTPQARAALIDGLRDAGMPERLETYLNLLEKGQVELPSQGDGVVAKQVWDRLSKSPEFSKAVMNSDPQALETMALLSALRAFAQSDGRPVSPVVQEFLRQRGLR